MANWMDKPKEDGWYIIKSKNTKNPFFVNNRHLIFIQTGDIFDTYGHKLSPITDGIWDNHSFTGPLDLE